MSSLIDKASGLAAAVLLGAAVGSIIGCSFEGASPPEPATSLGQRPNEPAAVQRIDSLDEESVGQTVAVEGEIVQQCPSVGCWFRVQDESGDLFVDLNPSGLRLKNKRVGQKARVTGRVEKIGKQFRLEAEFVEFQQADRSDGSQNEATEEPESSGSE